MKQKNTRSKTSDAERWIDRPMDGLLAGPSEHHLIQLNETSKQKFLVSSVQLRYLVYFFIDT